MKIVYVLTSDCEDVYADITYLSICSLRYYNPDAKIIIVCDQFTYDSLTQNNHNISDITDQIISVETPDKVPEYRNRYIKTNIRKYVDGNILYLDGDTVIRGDISSIFKIQSSLACATNHNHKLQNSHIPKSEINFFDSARWEHPDFYINGGVIFLSDNTRTHNFFDIWHNKWLQSTSTTGKYKDQPSLNSAILDSKIDITWLDNKYNAQVHSRPEVTSDAVIWHIYTSVSYKTPSLIIDKTLKKLRSNSVITNEDINEDIKEYTKCKHPWLIKNPLDHLAVANMMSNEHLLHANRWEYLWLSGKYLKSIKILTGIIFSNLLNPRSLSKSCKQLLKNLI